MYPPMNKNVIIYIFRIFTYLNSKEAYFKAQHSSKENKHQEWVSALKNGLSGIIHLKCLLWFKVSCYQL